jgi:hypothetical protein
MSRFTITFERHAWAPMGDEEGGVETHTGVYRHDLDLRGVFEAMGEARCEVDTNCSYPPRQPLEYLTAFAINDGTREFYEEGITENRQLFFGDSVTQASRVRVARLLGVNL